MRKKREPLLSDRSLNDAEETIEVSSVPVDKLYRFRDIYEAARAKDAELIQKLVNALEYVASYDNGCPLPTWEKGYNEAWAYANAVRRASEAEGFAPEDL